MRTSLPVRSAISAPTISAMPPRRCSPLAVAWRSCLPSLGEAPFGDDDHGAFGAGGVAPHDLVGDLGVIEGNLGNENYVGTACETAVERDPAGVASHHFEHHDALVARGRRVQPIQRVRHARDSRVEAKGHGGGFEVVINRLGDADDRESPLRRAGARLRGTRRRRWRSAR